MKLASLKSGRDGKLGVVSRDLSAYADAGHIAPTMHAALDDWARASPQLGELFAEVEANTIACQPFDQSAAHSPLPRAYQWVDGSAYVN